jgi:hypothetical protein
MSINRVNRGLCMQVINNHNSRDMHSPQNYASTYEEFNFQDDQLYLSRDYDSYTPKKLIIRLFADLASRPTEQTLNVIYRLLDGIRLAFKIGQQNILQLPLRLLWDLKTPVICNNCIYLDIPFETFFPKIDMVKLHFTDVYFGIYNCYEISNYSHIFSMICKVTVYNADDRSRIINSNTVDKIQQLSTLQVKYIPEPPTTDVGVGSNTTTTDFQINIRCFHGFVKGFFISCTVDDLSEIKFYINDVLRINYNEVFIRDYCVKISPNLLYLPFNDNTDFYDISGYDGSIKFNDLNSIILKLRFFRGQNVVSVHNLYQNNFLQTQGLASLVNNYQSEFIRSTTTHHPISSIISAIPDARMFDMSGNLIISSVINRSNQHNSYNHVTGASAAFTVDVSHGIVYDHASSTFSFAGATGPGPNYATTIGPTGPGPNYIVSDSTVGATGPGPSEYRFHDEEILYPVIIHSVTNHLIEDGRTTCFITHEEIGEGQHYMTCSSCYNNFNKTALEHWLSINVESRRTCPTCREIWTNYNEYINTL